MEAFLDPISMMGLNLLRDELGKRQLERADMESVIASLQAQIKETKNIVEVIDIGNKLFHKEFQKMNHENTVSHYQRWCDYSFSTSWATIRRRDSQMVQ